MRGGGGGGEGGIRKRGRGEQRVDIQKYGHKTKKQESYYQKKKSRVTEVVSAQN